MVGRYQLLCHPWVSVLRGRLGEWHSRAAIPHLFKSPSLHHVLEVTVRVDESTIHKIIGLLCSVVERTSNLVLDHIQYGPVRDQIYHQHEQCCLAHLLGPIDYALSFFALLF